MKKFLVERLLPMWAKETVLRENRRLKGQNRLLRQENENLHAYIRGVQAGLRTARKTGGA